MLKIPYECEYCGSEYEDEDMYISCMVCCYFKKKQIQKKTEHIKQLEKEVRNRYDKLQKFSKCEGVYDETYACDICHNYITESYIVTKDRKIICD